MDEELFVDTSRNEKMRINLDMTFPRMPCAYLSLDVMDVSGEKENDWKRHSELGEAAHI